MNKEELAYLINTHRILWAYRDELKTLWATPGAKDSSLFALTESGEALIEMMVSQALVGQEGGPPLYSDPCSAIRLAWIKSTQALDGGLRRNPTYNRNNAGKDIAAANEWADCAMMILTALGSSFDDLARGQETDSLGGEPFGLTNSTSSLLFTLAAAMYVLDEHPTQMRKDLPEWQLWLWSALGIITSILGADFAGLVEERLNRIKVRVKAKAAGTLVPAKVL